MVSAAPNQAIPRVRWMSQRRERTRRMRCRATRGARLPRSPSVPAVPCGETRPRRLLADEADCMLETDAELRTHPLSGEVEESQDIRGGGAAPVDDEVRVLGRDLGAADALAAQADLLDELDRRRAAGALPHKARRGQGERLTGALLLQPLLQIALDLRLRAAMQAQPAADEDGAGRRLKGLVAQGPGARLELSERAVGMEKVDGAHEVADPAVLAPRVHGQRPSHGGRNADQALDAAEVSGGGLAHQSRQTHPCPGQGLFALELRAAQTSVELQSDPAHTPIAHEQVVPSADHGHGELIAIGEL